MKENEEVLLTGTESETMVKINDISTVYLIKPLEYGVISKPYIHGATMKGSDVDNLIKDEQREGMIDSDVVEDRKTESDKLLTLI
jgi:hypothetical protein